MKVLIAAGGTGGHLFPAQQLARMLGSDTEVLFAGHKLSANPFLGKADFCEITAHPLRRGFITASWKGFWQSIRLMRHFQPDVVVGFGSYHAFPVLLAAAVLRKPIVLFEANCVLGKVNRFFAPVARWIAMQFPIASKKGRLVPLLPWSDVRKAAIDPSQARIGYGLDPKRETILVFGGSQGAAFLNEQVPIALAKQGRPVQVIHLAGSGSVEAISEAYQRLGISSSVKSFESQMERAYAAATIAVCRSGAGTVAELIRFGVPSLLIPYPYATEDHQRKNGEYLAGAGGARMALQTAASPERLSLEIDLLLQEEAMRKEALSLLAQTGRKALHLAAMVQELRSTRKKSWKSDTIS